MESSLRLLHKIVLCVVLLNVGLNSAQTFAGTNAVQPDVLHQLLEEVQSLKKLLTTMDAQLKTLQMTVERKMTLDDSACSVRDITEAIRTHKFQLAEEKLNFLTDSSKITNIVHDVYAGSLVNVDIILNFAKSLTNEDFQLLVFSAIREELSSSGHSDPFKLIVLVENLQREMTRQKGSEIKMKSQMVVDSAIEDIKAASTSILKAAMLNDKYQNNVEVDNLATAVFNFRTDVSNEIMERLVDSVFGVVAAGRILDNISSQKHIPQVITGLTAVFNRFNFAGNLNNDATITLASHLRKLKMREMYASLSKDLKGDVDKVIQQLPTCAKNIFFNTNVCLWNKGSGQYLYAASLTISYDVERRSIYTWYPGDIPAGALWKVHQMGDDFFFNNHEHENEYFYAAYRDYDKDMRYVFTWIAGNNTDPQSAWKIELDGDFCYLKNTFFNEYLLAPAVKYDQLNNYVFLWKPGTSVRSSEFQWQVRNCGQEETRGRT